MTTNRVRAGVDAYVWSARPDKNFGRGNTLLVASGTHQAYIKLKSPAPRNVTILEALLVLYTDEAFTGGEVELTVDRASASWRELGVQWEGRPGGVGVESKVTKTNPAARAMWSIPVTEQVQAIAYGAPNDGFRIRSNNGTVLKLRSLNAPGFRPVLIVRWGRGPQQPSKRKPAYGAVGVPKPKVSTDFVDRIGSTRISAMQVQVDPTYDPDAGGEWGGVDLFDSGIVLVDEPTVDLARTDLPGGVFGGFTTSPWPWRARTRDGAGIWSPWSDPAEAWYVPKGTVTIVAPSAGSPFVAEFTPPIVWTFVPPDGHVQTHYQVLVAKSSKPNDYIYDSGKLAGTATSHSLKKGVLTNTESYIVTVRVWDSVEREATIDQPVYASDTQEFAVAFDATVDPFTGITATQVGRSPWVDITVQRGTPPDSATILRDGVPIATDVPPGDMFVAGTTYRYRDWTARPGVQHTYQVRAEVNRKLASSAESAVITTNVVGIWLGDPDEGLEVVFGGKEYSASATDIGETYAVYGTGEVVRSVMAVGGLVGQCSNLMLRSRDGFTWEQQEEAVNLIKGRAADEFRLVFGDLNIPVVLANVTPPIPHQQSRAEQVLKQVSFDWWQTREHPFEVSF